MVTHTVRPWPRRHPERLPSGPWPKGRQRLEATRTAKALADLEYDESEKARARSMIYLEREGRDIPGEIIEEYRNVAPGLYTLKRNASVMSDKRLLLVETICDQGDSQRHPLTVDSH